MREFSHWLPLQLSWLKNFVLRKRFNQNKPEVISAPPFSGQVAYSSHCKWLRRYGIDSSTGPTAYISVCHFSIVKTDGVSATFPIRFVPHSRNCCTAARTFSTLLAAAKSAIWLIITYLSHYCTAKRCIQKGVLAADAVAFNQRNTLLHNKLHTSNTNKCLAKRVEKTYQSA